MIVSVDIYDDFITNGLDLKICHWITSAKSTRLSLLSLVIDAEINNKHVQDCRLLSLGI